MKTAHRTGVVTNMTLAEFQAGRMDQQSQLYVVSVAQHKTAATSCAQVVIEKEVLDICKRYCDMRLRVSNATTDSFLINTNGRPYKNYFKDVNVKLKEKGLPPITTRSIRNLTATLAKNEPDQGLALAESMGHSLSMAKSHYRPLTTQDAVRSYSTIAALKNSLGEDELQNVLKNIYHITFDPFADLTQQYVNQLVSEFLSRDVLLKKEASLQIIECTHKYFKAKRAEILGRWCAHTGHLNYSDCNRLIKLYKWDYSHNYVKSN